MSRTARQSIQSMLNIPDERITQNERLLAVDRAEPERIGA